MMKKSLSEKIFTVFNVILLSVLSFVCLYPLIYVLSASLSSPEFISGGKVWLWPKGFTVDAFIKVIQRKGIWMRLCYNKTRNRKPSSSKG